MSIPNLDRERFRRHYHTMVAIRAFEEAALDALKQGLVHGAIHPSIGQEAVAAGVCGNLLERDLLLSTHRGHGHTLAKGADPTAMMCELLGRAGGTSHGKGGSMHIADFQVGMLGANGVVAANIGIAAGAAHALKLRGEDAMVCCLFGDGAINRGPFLEGLNWAAVYGLPVLFVCEDNGFAATTRTRELTAGPGPVARAESLGIRSLSVDGNDILAVDSAARDLMDVVRTAGGPRFLHVRTYRLTGHTGTDPAAYREESEVAEAWQNDPIARCRTLLTSVGDDDAMLDELAASARTLIDEVYRKARDAAWPAPELGFAHVQDLGDPRQRAY